MIKKNKSIKIPGKIQLIVSKQTNKNTLIWMCCFPKLNIGIKLL